MKKIKLFLFAAVTMTACATLNQINLFSVEDDKNFGNEMYLQIQQEPTDYPVLDAKKYATAYTHVNRVVQSILNTGLVEYATEFDWNIQIIDADVLNAFACPGGKMYVYTGLIKFLDNESQLAGVLAHEMAHASNRHSTRQMTKQYGISYLSGLLVNQNSNDYLQLASQLAGNLGGLAFSRSDEYEADSYSVVYLSATEYNPLGVAGFFEKMATQQSGQQATLVFLSTHPSDADRIAKIQATWQANGSKKGNDFTERYQELKKSLPK